MPVVLSGLPGVGKTTDAQELARHWRGFAIRQGAIVKRRGPGFLVETVGREKIGGRDIVVLDCRDTASASFVVHVPKEFGNAARRHRGRLWLDAETGQLWRDTWEFLVPHPAVAEPLVVLRQERTDGPSPSGFSSHSGSCSRPWSRLPITYRTYIMHT